MAQEINPLIKFAILASHRASEISQEKKFLDAQRKQTEEKVHRVFTENGTTAFIILKGATKGILTGVVIVLAGKGAVLLARKLSSSDQDTLPINPQDSSSPQKNGTIPDSVSPPVAPICPDTSGIMGDIKGVCIDARQKGGLDGKGKESKVSFDVLFRSGKDALVNEEIPLKHIPAMDPLIHNLNEVVQKYFPGEDPRPLVKKMIDAGAKAGDSRMAIQNATRVLKGAVDEKYGSNKATPSNPIKYYFVDQNQTVWEHDAFDTLRGDRGDCMKNISRSEFTNEVGINLDSDTPIIDQLQEKFHEGLMQGIEPQGKIVAEAIAEEFGDDVKNNLQEMHKSINEGIDQGLENFCNGMDSLGESLKDGLSSVVEAFENCEPKNWDNTDANPSILSGGLGADL